MRIRVYVDANCLGCQRATELVTIVHITFPTVDIGWVAVEAESELPESLFAVPTWYVDERVWMLGNPTWDELQRLIRGS